MKKQIPINENTNKTDSKNNHENSLSNETCLTDTKDMGESDFFEEDDLCIENSSSDVLTYDYHIIYSESYSVPVLYLNVYKSDGKTISLGQIWDLCPSSYKILIENHKWTTLTQQMHPYFGRPFFQLHPCHT